MRAKLGDEPDERSAGVIAAEAEASLDQIVVKILGEIIAEKLRP